MRLNRWALLGCAGALGSSLWGQCYDLATTHLYQPDGRFQEQWDKPLWNGKPGEANWPGNFRLDQKEYGKDYLDFAIFIGTVRKTEAGWVPFKTERQPQNFCNHSGPRGSLFCWTTPYQTPGAQATLNPYSHLSETWTLTRAGKLTYVMRGRAAIPHANSGVVEDAVATLDLNTGRYEMIHRDHDKGVHDWAVKGGVEYGATRR